MGLVKSLAVFFMGAIGYVSFVYAMVSMFPRYFGLIASISILIALPLGVLLGALGDLLD